MKQPNENLWARRLAIVLSCGLIFYVVSMPFRILFQLNAITEVRPASALPPVFGLLWGVWGALGAALGNLVADLQSGFAPDVVAVGFVLQFLYGFVPCLLWYRFPLRSEQKAEIPRMDSTAHILKYLFIVLVNTVGMSLSLGAMMELFHIGTMFSLATLAMLLNNLVFTITLGIPLLILYSLQSDRHLSLNARVALFCVMQGVLSAGLVGFSGYRNIENGTQSPLLVWNRIFFSSFAAFLLFFILSILFLRYMERQVTVPAEQLSEAAKEYFSPDSTQPDHEGFISKCAPLCGLHSEIGTLALSFQRMARNLQDYMEDLRRVTAERERINAELNVATQIQASMLPCIFPAFPEREEFDIYATMEPAKEVGGDFYDFFLVDEDHLALVMADVSGKGVPAALFMVIAKTLLKNSTQTGASPGQVLEEVNSQLCKNNDAEMFVTVWLGILELSTGQLRCANAGHEYPALRRGDGAYCLLRDKHGFVLAGMDGVRYEDYSLQLQPGDGLYVYTDGVTEATDADGQLFGTERLLAALNQAPQRRPNLLLPAVRTAIDGFVGAAPQFDDITMLGLVYRGPGKEARGT